MSSNHVLLADNIQTILDLYGRCLRGAGYSVITAASPAEARRVLDEDWVDMAVLDWHLDDDSPEDWSGYHLAADRRYRYVAKVMFTEYPEWEKVVHARMEDADGLAPAHAFLSKKQSLEEFLDAVVKALSDHIPTDWSLTLAESSRRRLAEIAGRLMTDGATSMNALVRELEALFRRLFHQHGDQSTFRQLVIDRPFWERPGRLALPLYAYPRDTATRRQYLVVCGNFDTVDHEWQEVSRLLPDPPPPGVPQPTRYAATMRFAAIAYSLPGADLETAQVFRDYYRQSNALQVSNTLGRLVPPSTLAAPLAGPIEPIPSMDDLLRACFDLSERDTLARNLSARLDGLTRHAASLGVAYLDHSDGELVVQVPPKGEFFQASPLNWPEQSIKRPVRLGLVPRRPAADTVLVSGGQPWLTDLAGVTESPLLANFAALEAMVKFEAEESMAVGDFVRLENRLLTADGLGRARSEGNRLRRCADVIARLRQAAADIAGDDPGTYHRALFYASASYLLDFQPETDHPRRYVESLVLVAISLGKLAAWLQNTSGSKPPLIAQTGVKLHESPRRVTVDGRTRLVQSKEQFQVLLRLMNTPGCYVGRGELFRFAYGREYDPEVEENAFNMLIRRIRALLGETKEEPRYFFSEPREGYALFPNGNPDRPETPR